MKYPVGTVLHSSGDPTLPSALIRVVDHTPTGEYLCSSWVKDEYMANYSVTRTILEYTLTTRPIDPLVWSLTVMRGYYVPTVQPHEKVHSSK